MAATTARKTSQTAKPVTPPKIETQPGPQAQPAPKPQVTVEVVPVPYHRPTVTFPDGRTVVCQHKYLHETEKAAATCGRRIADRGEFVK